MATVKVGINGFGRIARVVLRSLETRETDIEVRAINVLNANLDRMVYMLPGRDQSRRRRHFHQRQVYQGLQRG